MAPSRPGPTKAFTARPGAARSSRRCGPRWRRVSSAGCRFGRPGTRRASAPSRRRLSPGRPRSHFSGCVARRPVASDGKQDAAGFLWVGCGDSHEVPVVRRRQDGDVVGNRLTDKQLKAAPPSGLPITRDPVVMATRARRRAVSGLLRIRTLPTRNSKKGAEGRRNGCIPVSYVRPPPRRHRARRNPAVIEMPHGYVSGEAFRRCVVPDLNAPPPASSSERFPPGSSSQRSGRFCCEPTRSPSGDHQTRLRHSGVSP